MSEKCIIVYEEHRSRVGPAASEWRFDPEPLMLPEFVGGGTHRKYLTLVLKGTKATLVRVSNRGNLTVKEVFIEGDCFLDFLGDIHPLPEFYKKYVSLKFQEVGSDV